MFHSMLGWLPLRALLDRPRPPTMLRQSPVLFVVEGPHDVEFLRRISYKMHSRDSWFPNLRELELAGELVFLPVGGNGPRHRSKELCRLGRHQVHLFDSEDEPETSRRVELACCLNDQPNCQAFVSGKRSLENYLHPDAVSAVCGVRVQFGDDDRVADLVAQRLYETKPHEARWSSLPYRSRKRMRDRAKVWLNRDAVEEMTIEQLDERDPDGEVSHWIATIAERFHDR